jgi:hypothetical protein
MCTIACKNSFLDEAYYFSNNNELIRITKQNDTLAFYKCNPDFECSDKVHELHKIINVKKDENKILYAVERIDSIPNTSKALLENRFSIIGIEQLTPSAIKFVHTNSYYNEDEISKLAFDFELVNGKFGYTFYEENYLKSLPTDFEIDVATYHIITDALKHDYDELATNYHNTQVRDTYKIGILSEIIAIEFIKRNWSPINYSTKLEKAHKKSLE